MEPTLKQLAEFLHAKKQEKSALTKAHDAAIKEIEDIIEGIEELILDTFAEGVDKQSVTFEDGTSATITRKVNSQFRINEGQSDLFYQWVQDNGHAHLLQRRIKQDAIEAEVKTNGLPPGVFVHTEVALGMTTRRAAPSI